MSIDKLTKKIGRKIKTTRAYFGMSQEKLAKLMGISRVALGHIEVGRRKIQVNELMSLAKVFESSCDQVLNFNHEIIKKV